MKDQNWKKIAATCLFLIAAFCAGRITAQIRSENTRSISIEMEADGNWGLSFPEEGQPPVANASMEELAAFDTYYAQDTEDKRIYLTFDCGYENGNTPLILDALKKHKAPATFFVVGNFVSTSGDLLKRMVDEGHAVGNHTFSHPDMSKISTQEAFAKELSQVEELFKEATGTEMEKYYRPPQGKYNEANLQMAKDMGYKTFFWSLAYVDWYQDQQPSKEEAFEKLLGRIHPGAIVLLHNTSSTNGQILDELLSKWEDMGYTFHPLKELWDSATPEA
ncbi:MAG: polysaccharide deacetylase family protein [Lachnospiraceae bacterium]|nr:polysaccharide deacetylase family protein [Lachnospiraceae bacterium]